MLGLQYKLVYKRGLDNKVADALSRNQHPEQLGVISFSTPRWLESIIEGYLKDPKTKELLSELSVTGSNEKGFSLVDGVIRYKSRIWLGNHSEAHRAVMLALHSSGLGGHSGITATYQKVKSLFAWPHMKQDIITFVNSCQVCSQAKPEHYKLPGLQHLPVPHQAWHTICLYFIEGLPKSKSFDTRASSPASLSGLPLGLFLHFTAALSPFPRLARTVAVARQARRVGGPHRGGGPTAVVGRRLRHGEGGHGLGGERTRGMGCGGEVTQLCVVPCTRRKMGFVVGSSVGDRF